MTLDTIFISNLEVRCVIGVRDWERAVTQQLLVDVALSVDVSDAAASDQLAHTIDYSAVCARVAEIARTGRFQLIEALAAHTAQALLDETPASQVTVTVHKPGAVPQAGSVGVRITRP